MVAVSCMRNLIYILYINFLSFFIFIILFVLKRSDSSIIIQTNAANHDNFFLYNTENIPTFIIRYFFLVELRYWS